MSLVLRGALRGAIAIVAVFAAAGGLRAQEPLDPAVGAEITRLVAAPLEAPDRDATRLWQAGAAAHGGVEPLLGAFARRYDLADDDGHKRRLARLWCGVLRFEGRAAEALRVLDRIPADVRTDRDVLLRAELLDALGRGDAAAQAYEDLLAREIDPALRRRILFRRALVGSDSIAQLKEFASREGSDREQRNQAAIILALRDEPKAALELYEVTGEGTERFRQLIRLAEWAIAAEQFDRAQDLAFEAVGSAKMRRDRRYAWTVVVSAYRAGEALDALLERFEATPDLDPDGRQLWIDVLRDEGRVDDALRLFQQEGDREWTPALRRQLLEICRETGREEVLVAQFEKLLGAEPDNLEWRSGLSRHYLETGDREAAGDVWADFDARSPRRQLDAAYSLMDLGLDERALRCAEAAAEDEDLAETARMFVVKLHVARGRFEQATRMLEEIEANADGADSVLAEVAGLYERIDRLDRAVAVLDRMRQALGGFLGTDLDMKYALLLSKVDREEDALAVWRSLWSRVRSTPRGRYVEDRMMTVAARLGVLAKIAIELEDRLDAGTADATDVELLVRLYIKVGDSAAATEITESALRASSADDLEIIRRKATIYLACHDYPEYERQIQLLIERDPENRIDHMRELTLSRLERGRRAQAIEELPRLRELSEDGGIADEFEAGIYQLAGLKDRALTSYTKGLGRYPDRIDTHLLVANLMRETGREMDAARRFQYLASTAERDDLFTIAIDGILNLRAQQGTTVPDGVVEWALRVTLERLAERSHRFYLHRLAADLAEELNDMPMSIRTLTAGIPVAGERRTALLRELLGKVRSLDRNARVVFGGSRAMRISPDWDAEPYVMIGRRLLGQGEVVPPQVFMDLATVFLHVDAVPDAMRTFSRAAELLDRGEVHRQAAQVLEDAERYDAALQFYRRLLAVDASDVELLVKIGRLEELAGRDPAALAAYQKGLDAALRQTALRVHVATEAEPDPNDLTSIYMGQRNVDAMQQALPRLVQGLLVTVPEAESEALCRSLRDGVEGDLAAIGGGDDSAVETIDAYPRLRARADALRRLALCFGHDEIGREVDERLLSRFPTDRALAAAVIGFRADRGYHRVAAALARGSSFASDPAYAGLLASGEPNDGLVQPGVAAARVLPLLVDRPDELRRLLDSVDTAAIDGTTIESVPLLLGACVLVGADDAGARIARAGVRIIASMSERDRLVQMRRSGTQVQMLARRLDPELARRLEDYRIERTAAKGPKALASLQYELEGREDFGLDPERVEEMLRGEVANSAQEQFGIRAMGLLHFLPADRRAPLVRELYTAAPNRKRISVLTEGGDHLVEPLSDGFLEWYEATLKKELADADDTTMRRAAGYTYTCSKRLQRIRVAAVLERGGSHREWLRLFTLRAELGERDDAVAMLREGIPDMLTRDDLIGVVPNRPKTLNTRQIDSAFDQFAAAGLLDEAAEVVMDELSERPEHEALRYMEWVVRTRLPGALEYVLAAVEFAADDERVEVLERALQFLRQRECLVESMDVLEQLVALDEPRRARWRAQLAAVCRQLDDPDRAKAVRLADRSQAAARAEARPARPARATALVATRVARLVAGTGTVARPPQAAGPKPTEPTGRVRALAQLADEDDARRDLRRLWRGREPARSRVISIYGPVLNLGINAAELRSIADREFVPGESRRMLRLMIDAGQLGAAGLAPVLVEVGVTDGDVDAWLARLADGSGGTVAVMRLIAALDDEQLGDDARARIVDALLQRREAPDELRLRRIADELAAAERRDAAGRIYRLATLASGGQLPIVYVMPRQRQQLDDTLDDVAERLGPEAGPATLRALLDDMLAVSETPEVMLTAVKRWGELLPAAERRERVLALRARVDEMRRTGRSPLSYNAQALPLAGALCEALAASGDLELALAELSELVCAATADAYGRVPRRNEAQIAKLLDELLAGDGDEVRAWLGRVGEAVLRWSGEGRLVQPADVLARVGVRLAEVSSTELAERCSAALRGLADDDPDAQLRYARLQRALGQVEAARAIERRLLASRRLQPEEHGRVLRDLAETDGVDVAYAAGFGALRYTRHLDLLRAMADFAAALGDTQRAADWSAEVERRTPKPAEEEAAGAAERAGR